MKLEKNISKLFPRVFVLSIFFLFIFRITPREAFAHAPDAIRIRQVLFIEATKVSFKRVYLVQPLHLELVWESIDGDGSKVITDEEMAVFGGDFPEFTLKVNGVPYALKKKTYGIPGYKDFMSGRDSSFWTGMESEEFEMRLGANELCLGVETEEEEGAFQFLEFLELETDEETSVRLKNFDPTEGLKLTVNMEPRVGAAKTTGKLGGGLRKKIGFGRVSDFVAENLQRGGLWLFAVFLLVAVFGALHALTPGHGKTIVGTYLIGKRGRIRDIITLGLTVTLTHTLLVYLLGFVSFALQKSQTSLLLSRMAEFSSAILVIIIALIMLISKVKPILPHNLQHLLGIGHSHEHSHHHHSDHDSRRSGINKELIALGISGGLVPCGDALLIMLLAVGAGKPLLGLALIFCFSLGLAATLIALGFLVIRSKETLSKMDRFQKIQPTLSFISPVIILIIGLGLLASLI